MKETNFEKILGRSLKSFEKRIYALCDFETLKQRDISLETFLDLTKKYDVQLIQYRDKISDLATQKTNLLYLKENTNIPIIINDKIELLEYADGLHLGQEDLIQLQSVTLKVKRYDTLLKLLRKQYPNKLFGLSTHNELEILEANELDLDMIGLGAYRTTTTKDVPNVLGDKISYLAKISKHPVCAIGGVKISDNIDNISFNVIGSGLYEN